MDLEIYSSNLENTYDMTFFVRHTHTHIHVFIYMIFICTVYACVYLQRQM